MDAQIFKALSDGSRLRILALLLERAYCVRALSLRLGLSESAVSQHMKVLRDADLAEGVSYGHYTHYRVRREALEALGRELLALAGNAPAKKPCDAAAEVGCGAARQN